jgi:hypothetical protein
MAIAWMLGMLCICLPQAATLDVAIHAANLRGQGFTVIPNPLVEQTLIDRSAANIATRLESLHRDVAAVGCDPLEQNYLFNEICHRQRMRWDLQMNDEAADTAHAELCRTIVATVVAPILEELVGDARVREEARGAIVSRQGAPSQRAHADAQLEHYEAAASDSCHRLFNCFIPLVDLAADGDGTQFWPGSHESSEAAMAAWQRAVNPQTAEEQVASAREAEAPACLAGGLVLFDFRIIHGGLASIGRDRPIAYVICSTGGAVDDSNFPEGRICDATAEDMEEFPFWDEIDFVQ